MSGGETKLTGPDFAAGVDASSLPEAQPVLGHARGEPVILVRRGERVHAVGASCTHYGGPLAEGLVVEGTLRCPWHHACFELATGRAVGAPALNPIACFEVVREGTKLRVAGAKPLPTAPSVRRPEHVVIVGAGAAGEACAETLRAEGYVGRITLLGAEVPSAVDRPNLSKDYLAGNAPEEWLYVRNDDYFREHDIALRTDVRVTAIDPAARSVTLEGGETIAYGALVLATGAEPIVLPIDGATLPHVYRLRTLADSKAIIARAATAKRAVVIGASFIGLEAAAALRQRKLEVTVVAPEALPLARVLGDELGAFVRSLHEAQGVAFRLGRKPAAIDATGVKLDDGSSVAADLVVMGVGVRPRLELAEKAGLKVDRGVVVDAGFHASAPGIYAIGDIARYPWRGSSIRVEHWQVAQRHGQHVARAICAHAGKFRDAPFFWSQHYDVTIGYVGHAEAWDRIELEGNLEARDAKLTYLKDGRAEAVATVGRDLESLKAEARMEMETSA